MISCGTVVFKPEYRRTEPYNSLISDSSILTVRLATLTPRSPRGN